MRKSTIAAIATGMSQSGIGIIRISGDESFYIALSVFRHKSGDLYSSFESHRVYYGFIYDGNEAIDEVLLLPMKAPKSFTGEDVIEIHCHGGIYILNRILEIVIKNGATIAEPGEFSKRAFINGRIDLSAAESVMDIISSKNEFALSNSVKHLKGRLYEEICSIRASLLYEIAFIESALDDPEHYSLIDYPDKLKDVIFEIINRLSGLSNSYNDGRLLQEGIKTVIIGKPNVGKSSFLNFISGNERAIVTDIAGTTRDTIEENISINGINLNIVDTAGIHDASDMVEEIGINKALKEIDSSDLIVIIIDSSDDLSEDDIKIFEIVKKSNKNNIILLNKSDIANVVNERNILEYIDSKVINFSTKTGFGLDDFKNYISDSFLTGCLKYNNELFITNARHKESLDSSIDSLKKVIDSIDNCLPEDFFTIDMNDAYYSLGLIIGEETSEDVVNEIFSKFCMGK